MLGLGLNIFTLAIRRYFGGGGGQFAGSSLNLDFTSGNQSLDPRITFTRASTGTRINSSGILESVAIDGPRFDYDPVTLAPKGLLIEEQRTNSIRNSTGQGAVAGSPGTLPTNWNYTGGGLAANVVGTGTEAGINYIDVQFVGTASSSSSGFRFEPTNQAAAASGQAWTSSMYIRRVAGSTAEFNAIGVNIFGRTSANAANTETSTTSILSELDVASISVNRKLHARTLSDATTAFVSVQILFGHTVGNSVDITLRIGLPQLEQGAFATSPIPTTTAAATRAADVAVMTGANFSNWYRQDEGTLFAETQLASAAARNAAGFDVNDGGTNNRTVFRALTTGSADQVVVRSGGATVATLVSASSPTSAVRKSAIAYRLDDFAFTAAGLTPLTDTLGAVPVSVNQMLIGFAAGPGEYLGGHIRRIAYFPRRLSNSELQGITS